jgi:excinuclease ABC subunit A
LSIASDAGLGYLRLMQKTETLSGGEAQRVKIVSHIMHTNRAHAFALDEPFRGVDTRNAEKLMALICRQVANGNSVFLIEHNPEILSCCSYLLEFGPGSGMKGGCLIYNGEKKKIGECRISRTRQYLT